MCLFYFELQIQLHQFIFGISQGYINMATFIDQSSASTQLHNFKQTFNQKIPILKDKPTSTRGLNDICCCVFFLIFLFAFVGYSAYSINTMSYQLSKFQDIRSPAGTILEGVNLEELKTLAIVVFSCLGGAVLVALGLCAMLCIVPNYGIWIMSLTGSIVILSLAIYFVAVNSNLLQIKQFSTFFFIVAALLFAPICALKDDIEKAAILMKTIKVFILKNPKIIILVILTLFYCLILLCLWCAGFYSFCVLYEQQVFSYQAYVVSSVFWAFVLFFFNFYFYYTSVFLTSFSLAIWFYQPDGQDPLSTPIRQMVKSHLGTITFAALIVSFINFVKFMFTIGRCTHEDGICRFPGHCFSFLVCCCVGGFQALSQVLNSYAIITSALTGQSFIQSAKIVGHIAFQDYESFSAFTIVGHLMRIGALIFTCSIPTISGSIIILNSIGSAYIAIAGSLLIMFTTSIIGMVILQVFMQSINALFVMYRIDSQLTHAGHEVTWVQQFGKQLDKGFEQAFIDNLKKKPKPKYKNVTTIIIHQNGATQVHQQRIQKTDQQQMTLQVLN